MRHSRGRVVEVDDIEEFDRRIAAGARDLSGWRCRSLDLTGRSEVLGSCLVAGSMFLGCRFDHAVEALLDSRGAIVFPSLPAVPLDTYRTSLYTAEELFGQGPYATSLDARTYAWAQSGLDHDGLLAASLHDHAVDGALADWVDGRSVVGVMGGHAVRRGTPAYDEAARLGWLLGQAHTVATGGGPGAMEAANLGARFAAASPQRLRRALATVAEVPGYRPAVRAWLDAGFRALADAADDGASGGTLGIPTWHYGHEPPNVFATAIAKYVRNALREAVLLEVCNVGIVFLPGAAGTVQEVFQDACENYYADPSSLATMVLVGRHHWEVELPAWPLLSSLARERDMSDRVHLVDDVEEAAALLA